MRRHRKILWESIGYTSDSISAMSTKWTTKFSDHSEIKQLTQWKRNWQGFYGYWKQIEDEKSDAMEQIQTKHSEPLENLFQCDRQEEIRYVEKRFRNTPDREHRLARPLCTRYIEKTIKSESDTRKTTLIFFFKFLSHGVNFGEKVRLSKPPKKLKDKGGPNFFFLGV